MIHSSRPWASSVSILCRPTHGLVVLLAMLSSSLSAQVEKPLCTVGTPDYKVVASSLIAVHCSEDVSTLAGLAVVYDLASSATTPIAIQLEVKPYPGASHWLLVSLASSQSPSQGVHLQYGKKYRVALALHKPAQPINPQQQGAAVNLDVNNVISVSPAASLGSSNEFELDSHVAFKSAPVPTCTLQVEDFLRRITDLRAHCRSHALIPRPETITADNVTRWAATPEDLGSLILDLDNGNKETQQLPYAVPQLIDVFGKPVKIDAKSQIVPEKAPANKDASSYFVNFNHAAAKGNKPGWILDAKLSPPIGDLHHGFQFVPVAAADVGQNQISGLSYTDTINIGPSFTRVFQPTEVLQEVLFSPGVTYETDKEFDRHNVLFTPDARLNFAGLYNPRNRRTLRKYSRELAYAQCTTVPPGVQAGDCQPIPWSTANTKPVLMGYVLDFHAGLEVGGSLIDTTVKASNGKAKLALPRYPIARPVPKIHGLWEIGRFSIDATGTARFLATVENSVLERRDHTLYLRRDHGWFGYGVISGNWAFDPVGHFGLTVSYKNGFSPPKFSRVNTVQSGITLKY